MPKKFFSTLRGADAPTAPPAKPMITSGHNARIYLYSRPMFTFTYRTFITKRTGDYTLCILPSFYICYQSISQTIVGARPHTEREMARARHCVRRKLGCIQKCSYHQFTSPFILN